MYHPIDSQMIATSGATERHTYFTVVVSFRLDHDAAQTRIKTSMPAIHISPTRYAEAHLVLLSAGKESALINA